MSTPWKLYNEVSSGTGDKYITYRCPNPTAIETKKPWFNMENVCPCNPKLSGESGRGFMSCPYGIKIDDPNIILNNFSKNDFLVGSLNASNYQLSPPQLDPRQITKIGYEWRSGY